MRGIQFIMLYSVPNIKIYMQIKNRPRIPLEYTMQNYFKKANIYIGENAINSVPEVPIWNCRPVTVDITLSGFDKSSTSTVFKGRLNELKLKYCNICHICIDGYKVKKVASAYVCPYGKRGHRLKDCCSSFTAEVAAVYKALKYVKVSSRTRFATFSDNMSVL